MILRHALVVALAGVVVAGCSSTADGAVAPRPTTTVAAPDRGGILRLALERPQHLDPARAQSVPPSELVVADLLYDGLTAYEPASGRAVPAIAADWEVADEGRTWRFTIRADATFADGSPVRASDVEASLERVVRAGGESPAARLLRPVAGWDAMATGAATELAGVTVEGDDVVVIALDEPESALAEVLASPLLGIAPAAATGDSLDVVPSGSGPFRLAAGAAPVGGGGVPATGVVRLERVPDGAAVVDGVDLVLVDDGPAAVAAVEAGDADIAFVPAEQGPLGPSVDEVAAPFGAELFYGFNLRSPKLADPRLREAVLAAVDAPAIAADAYGGALAPLDGVVPAEVPGAADDPCGDRCAHDPDRARALVQEAFPTGGVPELFVDVDAGGRQEAVGAAIAADLQAVGIPASVRPHPIEDYPAFLASGQHELFRLGWSGGWPSAGAYLPPLFRSGAPENVVGLALPSVDEALARAASAPERTARDAAYADAERLVMAELPVLPIGQFRTRLAVGPRVRDVELSVLGTFDATRVRLVADR